MEKIGIHAISLTRDELIGALAAIDTVLDHVGEELGRDDPEKHGLLLRARTKLLRLLNGPGEAIATA